MSQIARIDNALRRGLGLGAKVIGNQYDVYRLNNASTGSIIQTSNKVISSFNARFSFMPPKTLLEQTELYNQWYTAMVDTRQLKMGDMLVEVGPSLTDTPDGRIFCLVDVTSMRAPIFARCEVLGALTRPNDDSIVDQPLQGEVDYQGQTKFTEWISVLTNGFYDMQGTGSPAVIPMGLQPHIRMGPGQEIKYPTSTPRGVYYGWCPLLPGLQIQPGDMVADAVGNRYQIQIAHVFTTGLQGWQLTMHSVFI